MIKHQPNSFLIFPFKNIAKADTFPEENHRRRNGIMSWEALMCHDGAATVKQTNGQFCNLPLRYFDETFWIFNLPMAKFY
jgi:hypothetical protein